MILSLSILDTITLFLAILPFPPTKILILNTHGNSHEYVSMYSYPIMVMVYPILSYLKNLLWVHSPGPVAANSGMHWHQSLLWERIIFVHSWWWHWPQSQRYDGRSESWHCAALRRHHYHLCWSLSSPIISSSQPKIPFLHHHCNGAVVLSPKRKGLIG